MNAFKEIQQKILKITEIASEIYDIPRFMDSLIEQVFLRSGRFIMEFIQNAEDACMVRIRKGEIKSGILRIELHEDKVVIMHNGKPFDKEDLIAICGLKSKKKPEEGYLGYLGIGFKSVFKVSNKVIIYSRGKERYCFKFDKEEAERRWGKGKPWQSLPIGIPPYALEITLPQRFTTMFIVYLKDPLIYDQIRESLEKLRYPLFLFLRYIKEIEIKTSSFERKINIVPQEYEEREKLKIEKIFVVEKTPQSTSSHEFLVFRKTFKVPEDVREDDVTKGARRDKVKEREVCIAFLIKNNKLSKIEGEMTGGFYSFLPLEEARTGLGFLIQADFITQAGREQIVFEAKWNKWMMQRVADVIEEAIKYFQEDPAFCESYLPIFEMKRGYDEFYMKLVEPILKRRIDSLLEDPKVPTLSGDLIPLSKAVVCSSEIIELVEDETIKEEDLEIIFGEEGLRFIGEDVKLGEKEKDVRKLTIADILSSKDLIEKRKEKGIATKFLIKIYKYASKKGLVEALRFRNVYVLDRWSNVVPANECYFSALPDDVKELLKKYPEIKAYLSEYRLIHPELEEIREILEQIGVRYITYREICEKALLPKLSVENKTKLSKKDILMISALLKKARIFPHKGIWVLTRDGNIRKSEEVFMLNKDLIETIFKDIKDFNSEILDINCYLGLDGDEEGWQKFFACAGVKLLKEYNNLDEFISEHIIPMIEKKKNDKKLLVKLTWIVKELKKSIGGYISQQIPVLTKDGSVSNPKDCYLASAYNPQEDWEKWTNIYCVGSFVSEEYLKIDNDVEGWKSFFQILGVKESVKSEIIGEFAEVLAEHILRNSGFKIRGRKGEGYDLLVEKNGETLYIQVKGRKKIMEIELQGKEVEKALKEKESYCLMVIYNIPNNPIAYLLKNPADKGEQTLRIVLKPEVITQQGQRLNWIKHA